MSRRQNNTRTGLAIRPAGAFQNIAKNDAASIHHRIRK
jgi:hypothetical protein